MTPSSERGPSWALDTPGLSASDAHELVKYVREAGLSDFASAVDPANSLTLHLDVDTVQSLVRVISFQGEHLSPDDLLILEGVTECLVAWLDKANGKPES